MGGFSSYIWESKSVLLGGEVERGKEKTNRVLPQQERTRILESNIRHMPQRIPVALLDLPPLFVLPLLGRAALGEGDGDIGGELKGRTMEGAKVGFGETSLVL